MITKILILVIIATISPTTFGRDEAAIKSRKLEVHSYDSDDYSAIEQQAKEIKNSLGRVEILEHKLSQFNDRLEILDSSQQHSGSAEKLDSSPINYGKVDEDTEDVFSASLHGKNVTPNNDKDLLTSSAKETKKETEAAEIPLKLPKTLVNSPASANKEEPKEKKLYDLAIAALKDNKFEIAEKKFAELIQIYPNSALQSNSYFWYGETFFRRGVFDKAAVNYLKGYKKFPKGAKAADSLLKLAIALGELKKKPETCSILTKLEEEFPNRPASSIKRTKDAKTKFGCK